MKLARGQGVEHYEPYNEDYENTHLSKWAWNFKRISKTADQIALLRIELRSPWMDNTLRWIIPSQLYQVTCRQRLFVKHKRNMAALWSEKYFCDSIPMIPIWWPLNCFGYTFTLSWAVYTTCWLIAVKSSSVTTDHTIAKVLRILGGTRRRLHLNFLANLLPQTHLAISSIFEKTHIRWTYYVPCSCICECPEVGLASGKQYKFPGTLFFLFNSVRFLYGLRKAAISSCSYNVIRLSVWRSSTYY